MRLSDAMPDIGRVLGAWGQVLIRGKAWRSGGMSVSGGVMAWALYAPEDGSEPRWVESWIPFQLDWNFPDTERDGTIRAAALLKGVDARSVSARKLMFRANVSILGEALEPVEAELFQPGEVPEDVRLLKRSYPISVPKEAGEKSFLLDEELTLPESQPAMEKLVRFSLRPEVLDQKVMAEKVVFRGTANLHLLYRGTDERFHVWDQELPFSQYADLEEDYSQEASAGVIPAVTSLEVEQEGERLRLKAGLVGQYLVYDRPILELVEDAYSPRRGVTPKMEELTLPAVLETRRETVHGLQSLPGFSGEAVETALFLEQPRLRRREEQMDLELPGSFQVLSYNGEGVLESACVRWEEQLTLPVGEGCALQALAWPVGQPRTDESSGEARGNVDLELTAAGERGLSMVTALELGEEREPDPARPSLILRRAGEQRLWDLAKGCGSTVEAIIQANGLQGEPDPARLLLIPIA